MHVFRSRQFMEQAVHAVHGPECCSYKDEKGMVPLPVQQGRQIMSSELGAGEEGLGTCEEATSCLGEATSFFFF